MYYTIRKYGGALPARSKLMKKTNTTKKLVLVKTTVIALQDKLTDEQLKQVGGGSLCAGTQTSSRTG